MQRNQTVIIALVLFATFFMIFIHSTLQGTMIQRFRAGPPEDFLKHSSIQANVSNVTTQSPKQESFIIAKPDIHIVSVSDSFRKSIPKNTAYWNRLLHLALSKLDKGENPLIHDNNWSRCRETNQEHLKTNMHDFSRYPVLFQDFLQGMNCRSPLVLLNQPNKCIPGKGKGDNQTFLLFAIKSSPENFVNRQAVRETWGQEGIHQSGLRVRLVFLLGTSPLDNPNVSALLSFEAKHYGDILQWDFHESLLNLTLKMSMFLQWTLTYCPNATFVFSGDDDVFVNTPALLSYLQSLEPAKASQLYGGNMIISASPNRDPKNKYYIPQSFYDGQYPTYAGGGGFLISGALLRPLYSVLYFMPFFPIDDVYVGMCFNALGVSAETIGTFRTFDIKEQDRENLCAHKNLILIHQRSPRQMEKLWKGIHSPMLTC